jgi:hypothetical protein
MHERKRKQGRRRLRRRQRGRRQVMQRTWRALSQLRAVHCLPKATSTHNPVKEPRRNQLPVCIRPVSPLRPHLQLLLYPLSPRAGLVSGRLLVAYLLKMPTIITNTPFPFFKSVFLSRFHRFLHKSRLISRFLLLPPLALCTMIRSCVYGAIV